MHEFWVSCRILQPEGNLQSKNNFPMKSSGRRWCWKTKILYQKRLSDGNELFNITEQTFVNKKAGLMPNWENADFIRSSQQGSRKLSDLCSRRFKLNLQVQKVCHSSHFAEDFKVNSFSFLWKQSFEIIAAFSNASIPVSAFKGKFFKAALLESFILFPKMTWSSTFKKEKWNFWLEASKKARKSKKILKTKSDLKRISELLPLEMNSKIFFQNFHLKLSVKISARFEIRLSAFDFYKKATRALDLLSKIFFHLRSQADSSHISLSASAENFCTRLLWTSKFFMFLKLKSFYFHGRDADENSSFAEPFQLFIPRFGNLFNEKALAFTCSVEQNEDFSIYIKNLKLHEAKESFRLLLTFANILWRFSVLPAEHLIKNPKKRASPGQSRKLLEIKAPEPQSSLNHEPSIKSNWIIKNDFSIKSAFSTATVFFRFN